VYGNKHIQVNIQLNQTEADHTKAKQFNQNSKEKNQIKTINQPISKSETEPDH
jgi:hypothetical protein